MMLSIWTFYALTTLVYVIILQATFILAIAFAKDPTSLFDVNDSVDRIADINADDVNLMASIENPNWNLFNSQPFVNQDLVGAFDESSFIPDGGDSSVFQDPDPDSDLYNINLDSNSSSDINPLAGQTNDNDQGSTIDPTPLSSSLQDDDDGTNAQVISTALRFDFWNFWPFSCTFKLGSQGVCCRGPEDDRGVRHGCGGATYQCNDISHRFCCALADKTYTTRTWCVAPPPDGQEGPAQNA